MVKQGKLKLSRRDAKTLIFVIGLILLAVGGFLIGYGYDTNLWIAGLIFVCIGFPLWVYNIKLEHKR